MKEVSNIIIFKGKPLEIKNYKPTELEIQLANGEFDKLAQNESDNDDSFDAVCLDDDKDVICEKIKEWEQNGDLDGC